MKTIFKAFSKNLFGAKYERLTRTIFIYPILFWGLYTADFKVQISPFILYLMVTSFTTGVMWQTLSSEDNAANMQNMIMLPFEGREFIFSYIGAMGIYTFLTKTMALLVILLAVSVWNRIEILSSILCAVNAILMAAAIFSVRRYWYVGTLWLTVIFVSIFFGWEKLWFIPMLSANSTLAFLLLQSTNGYTFYFQKSKDSSTVRGRKHLFVWTYFFRYLKGHKNYLMNIAIMWCIACILPLFFQQMDSLFVIPIGFAILSLNTPVCILLSCDHALEQAVRFLPGQKKTFCIPYCLFIFLCNITADMFFLFSWQIQIGGVTVLMVIAAIFFAMQSAVFSVLLEWFYPIRRWKIESDLWHHPRKYIVPAIMLLLAGIVGTLPLTAFVLIILLTVEVSALLIQCWRC
ncbi:MAG: hypothetical protein KH330_08830 [Clostridiales bacterium]|nr:hypothetical protein [Clostridiales bacterium]